MTTPKRSTPQPPWWPVLMPLITAFAAMLMLPSAEAAETIESRPVPAFQAISLAAAIELKVRQTGTEGVRVTADPAVLPMVETLVEPGDGGPTLLIRVKPGQRLPMGASVRVDADVAQLGSLRLFGSGDLDVDRLNTPALKIELRGSGDIRLRGLDTERLDIAISGSGDVHADGRTRQLTLSIAGSGDAALGELAAETVKASIAGSGDATVRASQAAAISIAGSGDVEVLGNPPSVKQSVAGSGEVVVRR
jgi:hypothetical protein